MRIKWFFLLTGAVLMGGCALKKSIKARTLLAKCEYELIEVTVKVLDFAPVISFDNSRKKINIENPGPELLGRLENIKKGRFNLHFNRLTFDALIEVKNPNSQRVIMDSLYVNTYLDKQFVVKVTHPEHMDIPAGRTNRTRAILEVPTTLSLTKVLNAQNIHLKGKAWLRLAIFTEDMEHLIPISFSVTRPVPRQRIKKAIEKEKEKIQRRLLRALRKQDAGEKLKRKGKRLLKKMF